MEYLKAIYVIPHFFEYKNKIHFKYFFLLEKKSLRIIYFRNLNVYTSRLFKESKIVKLLYKIALENCPL